MYYPIGWPKILKLPTEPQEAGQEVNNAEEASNALGNGGDIVQVICNRDKILTAVLSSSALHIWYVKVSISPKVTIPDRN